MRHRVRERVLSLCVLALLLEACATQQPPAAEEPPTEPQREQFIAQSGHSPPFARYSYSAFSRADAVAIAQQEWRLFGQRVFDDPPDSVPQASSIDEAAHQPGYWERIGEYWWLGQNAERRESAWTGMHDEGGQEIADGRDDYYAWSAAFISYVMRTAGAGARFPYAPSHYVYINVAKEMKLGRASGWAVIAERVDEYAPVPGDLICFSRTKRPLTYEKLPVRHFPAHCDMVVARDPGQLTVIGGNVEHAVTMKHVPLAGGRLAEPGEHALDTRYPWFVVLRVLYDR
jgi:hypothetical protein